MGRYSLVLYQNILTYKKKINHGMHFIFASEFRTRGRALSLEENTRTLLLFLMLLLAKISRNMFVYLLRHPLWNFFTMFSWYGLAFFSWNTQCSKIRKKMQFQKCKNTLFAFSKMAKNQFLHQKKV